MVAEAVDLAAGKILVKNRRWFTDLRDVNLVWSLEKNGREIAGGTIRELGIAPESAAEFTLGYTLPAEGVCTLNLSFRQNRATAWASVGHELGFTQLLCDVPMKAVTCTCEHMPATVEVTASEDERYITVCADETVYRFDKPYGALDKIEHNGAALITKPVKPTVWRAPTDNDRNIRNQWQNHGFNNTEVNCYDMKLESCDGKLAIVTAKISLSCYRSRPVLRADVKYIIFATGEIRVTYDAKVEETVPFLPRFGVELTMPEMTENLRYFGYGPVESYQDKHLASRLGDFTTTVTDEHEPYVKPQENSAHWGTKWAMVWSIAGHGLLATAGGEDFSFNASHYSPAVLTNTAHEYELVPSKETTFNIDYKQSGVGSNSCGPALLPQYQLNEKEFTFTFRLKPVFANDVDPYEEMTRK